MRVVWGVGTVSLGYFRRFGLLNPEDKSTAVLRNVGNERNVGFRAISVVTRQTWNIALHILQSTFIEFLLQAGRLSSNVASVCAFGMLILRQRTCKCLVCFSQAGKTKHWLSLTRVRTRRAEGPGITAHAPSPPLASFSETKQVGCQPDMCTLQRWYNFSERKFGYRLVTCKDSVPASIVTHINTWK